MHTDTDVGLYLVSCTLLSPMYLRSSQRLTKSSTGRKTEEVSGSHTSGLSCSPKCVASCAEEDAGEESMMLIRQEDKDDAGQCFETKKMIYEVVMAERSTMV